jgi:hypothetical protein
LLDPRCNTLPSPRSMLAVKDVHAHEEPRTMRPVPRGDAVSPQTDSSLPQSMQTCALSDFKLALESPGWSLVKTAEGLLDRVDAVSRRCRSP